MAQTRVGPDGRRRTERKPRVEREALPWAQSVGAYVDGACWIEAADAEARRVDGRWGVGRVLTLIPTELRIRVERQRALWNQAVWSGDLEAVRRESPRMQAAWRAADRAAAEAHPADDFRALDVWEVALPTGEVLVLGRTPADLEAWGRSGKASGRACVLWTLEEVATLVGSEAWVQQVKRSFPGASVDAVTLSPQDVLASLPTGPDPIDEIPF